ncbi:MAG: hypothetical protein JL50_21660 [Peptococcaceae bacterium BICA1-7]|nr:MAG: hypothetical protein JL50_21660 [Peptococcaceae bacterium BICA1-7]HBV99345.1 hypothetical protein [Desulfotomaculum sp.]
MRKMVLSAFIFMAVVLTAVSARADTFNDDFSGSSNIDFNKTTAYYNSEEGCMELPLQEVPNALALQDVGQGYAVATTDGIKMYELDDATGQVAENPAFSCDFATDSIGVAIQQDTLGIWSITRDSVAYYRHEGGSMADNPHLKVSGLSNLLSVAGFKNSDRGIVLKEDDDGKAVVDRYEVVGTQLQNTFTYNPDITDPVAVSIVNDSPDFRLATKDAVYYFMYDDGTGGYVEDPAKKISGLEDIAGVGADNTGNAIMTPEGVDYFLNLDDGGAVRVDDYSLNASDKPVAVSLRAGTVEYAYINEDGLLKYYTLDDATDQVVRDISLEPSAAFSLNRGYLTPRLYYSKAFSTAEEYDAVYLEAVVDIPAGTAILFQVSSDGVNFYDIELNTWDVIPKGNNFVVKAELSTTDSSQTPRINRVELTVGDDFQIVANVEPEVAERGRNILVTARAVKVDTGGTVDMDFMTAIIPMAEKEDGSPALPGGQPSREVSMTNTGSQWEYIYSIGEKTLDDRWPDDGIYMIEVTGTKGAVRREARISLEIRGHILNRVIVRTYS